MTPEAQIDRTIQALYNTLRRQGWPNSRREDLAALVTQLSQQWEQYKAGALVAPDPSVER